MARLSGEERERIAKRIREINLTISSTTGEQWRTLNTERAQLKMRLWGMEG